SFLMEVSCNFAMVQKYIKKHGNHFPPLAPFFLNQTAIHHLFISDPDHKASLNPRFTRLQADPISYF
ncbi:MAG TPA: hypothetical protein VN249_08150, partial [Prolixibacteraceae bacterium]|nr:hypothetical protein [Prolixibacteraceae bacterium]